MRPFARRPITFTGLAAHRDWRLKRYSIAFGDEPVDWSAFEPGIASALRSLPDPAVTAERPGVGLLITHRGAGADYVVLAWWDRENELPLSIVVREQQPGAQWRPARGGESVCVWDLEVIGFERDAYVETVLAPGPPAGSLGDTEAGRRAYLERRFGVAGEAGAPTMDR